MSEYRDDMAALRARVEALEEELAHAKAEGEARSREIDELRAGKAIDEERLRALRRELGTQFRGRSSRGVAIVVLLFGVAAFLVMRERGARVEAPAPAPSPVVDPTPAPTPSPTPAPAPSATVSYRF